jgi:hypothetical protein
VTALGFNLLPEENITMRTRRQARIYMAVATAALFGQLTLAPAQTAATTGSQGSTALRDGQHDFDPLIGTWKAKLKLLAHPLSGSSTWVEYEGTQITRAIWGARAILDEFSAHSPSVNSDVEGLTIRLYNRESHLWSIYWCSSKKGAFGPPTVGRFTNGRGEFYHQADFEGRPVFVRYVWSDITATSARFEQSFSDDGGRTWEPNSIDTLTRVKE